MSSGIVTIATGSDRYYIMAKNLLHSIKVISPSTNVAIITDKYNHYIYEYDGAETLVCEKDMEIA